MSIKSQTNNQTNSDKNDHATGVEYCEESDTWKCIECGARKFDEEGAVRCCGDGDDNESLSMSLGQEPPEALQERDIWLCWRYEKRDGMRTKVPINPTMGGRGSSTNPDSWVDYETAWDYHASDTTNTDGLGFVFSEEGLLAGVDLDNVRNSDAGEVEPWAKEIIDELDSYTELSPSGTGFHIVVFGMKPGDSCKTGMESTLGAFDEAELEMYEDGRFFTYTGEHVEGTPKTVEQRKASLSEVYDEHLADDDSGGGVATAEVEGSKPDLNLSDEMILAKARNAENSEKFTRLYDGEDSYHGNDTSKADKAFCQMLAYWTGGDRKQMDRLFRNSDRMRPKWTEDRGNQTYGERTIEAALKDQTEFYDPSHTSPSETRESGGEYDSVASALVADPERWIDAEKRVITAFAAGGMSANEVAESLKDHELPGDANLFDIASGLTDENREAFREFWKGGEDWTVISDTGEGNGWRDIRHTYADSDMSNKQARDAAFRRLTEDHSFATFEDTDDILVYDPEKGIYQENGEAIVKSQLQEGIQDQYTKREVSEIVDRIKSASYCKRDEFGVDETNPQVCVANGVLDLSEIGRGDENPEVGFHDHSPQRKFLTRLPVEYDPDAECPNFEEFLGDVLGNETDEQLIYEVLGYCLWPSYPFAKALFLYGDGANGKSTLLDVFTELLGTENVSSRSMVALEEDRYAKADLYGSFANIAGDLSNQTLKRTGTLKTLTGGDAVTADEKYKQPFSFQNRAKLVFAANDPPKIQDESSALYRRLLLVNFPEEFTSEGQPGPDAKPKHQLMQEIASDEELSGILNKALSALAGVFQRGQFSQNGGAEDVREHYKKISDPVYAFTQDCIKEKQGETVAKAEVYEAYDNWARENDAPAKAKNVLSKDIQNHVRTSSGKTTADGERVQAYKGIQLMID